MSIVQQAEWFRQKLMRDPLYQALLKREHRKLYDEAQRILKEGAVNWLERSKENAIYHVSPITYEVRKVKGQWFCECGNFSHYNVCEHILAIQIQEGK